MNVLNQIAVITNHFYNIYCVSCFCKSALKINASRNSFTSSTLEGSSTTGGKPNALFTEKDYYTINTASIVNNPAAMDNDDEYPNNNGIYNNNPNSDVDATSAKVYKLTGTGSAAATGLGITIRVMSGDKIDILGKSFWTQHNNSGANQNLLLTDIIAGLLATPDGLATSKGATVNGLATGPNAVSIPETFLNRSPNEGDTKPMAYINYILLDEQFQYVKSGFSRVGPGGSVKDHFADLQHIGVTQNGYLYVYCSNQSPVDVYFDNLQIVHTRGPLVEETHYYPFGLTMAGISSKALNFGGSENKIKFQKQELQNKEFSDGSGLETYQFKYRMDDPQVGRFWQIDPLANKYVYNSTYAFSENKVTSHIELEGLESESIHMTPKLQASLKENVQKDVAAMKRDGSVAVQVKGTIGVGVEGTAGVGNVKLKANLNGPQGQVIVNSGGNVETTVSAAGAGVDITTPVGSIKAGADVGVVQYKDGEITTNGMAANASGNVSTSKDVKDQNTSGSLGGKLLNATVIVGAKFGIVGFEVSVNVVKAGNAVVDFFKAGAEWLSNTVQEEANDYFHPNKQ
ncbi:MAG: hypothetical protein JST21_02340 [Bacteroidetes bacterium]|nr:hypothetical protein [Bacteroidota bacterium]